ncbi:MAG: AAA family ATPase [Candidatus Pacearchaeota archaeon]|nr:AAA family ATPase [Candidatus Pacearchaeota archaeon]
MGRTIGLISLKGGVGKTTLSAALAVSLANNFGKKVLLIDANYSAPNLGIHMDIISPSRTIHDVLDGDKISSAIHYRYGVDVIPGNFLYRKAVNPLKLRNRLAYFKRNYDFVILDASPSLNNEVLSTILASDNLFIISTPDYPTLSCSMKAAKLARERNNPIEGIILNKVKGKYDVGLEEIQESTGIPVVAKIKNDKIVNLALHERVPAPLFSKGSAFSKEVMRFAGALVGEKEKRGLFLKIRGKDNKKERVNRAVLRESFYEGMFGKNGR